MARSARVDVGDQVYHVLNRAVGRLTIFEKEQDYSLFQKLLLEIAHKEHMRIISFVLMPNHWHLQLYPQADGDLGRFMHALTNAHTRKVHTITKTIGTGPLYQGRYKSFLIQDDIHSLTVLKYIERNPVRARLCKRVQDWRWGSAWVRTCGTQAQRGALANEPTPVPQDYLVWVNQPDNPSEIERLRTAVNKGTPYGRERWVDLMVQTHELRATIRPRGRPQGS
jgi:putative transposase